MVFGPRFGMAYDVTGRQGIIIRGGAGLFYDRPDGNTVFSIPGNPPISTSQDLRNGQLATLGTGLSTVGVPALSVYEYDSKIPASVQWQAGVQLGLRWASSLDVSYVGNHGYNRLGAFQGGSTVNLNAIDIGAAYQPQNQDPTLAASTVPGATAYTTNLLRPFRGLSTIAQQTARFYDTFHGLQMSFNRRYQNSLGFGVNYNLMLSLTGNTGLQLRLQHAPDGTISVRPDQAAYEELNKGLDPRRHIIKANATWNLPDLSASSGLKRGLGFALNDWEISGVLTAGSGTSYDLGFTYQTNGNAVNLTGSPDYNGRIVYLSDPGSGCSDDQFRQFNAGAVRGPTYGSVGMESGRNMLIGCPNKTIDLSLVRSIRMGGSRQLQLRVDAFNAFNAVVINARNTTVQFNNPTSMTVVNSQTLADGSLDPARRTPRTAGFGAATGAQDMRNLQLQIRFQF
jgi:hypothetical protein